ncbi:MAG: BamA/TamA family outer membrane protein [Planctomycetes bacterium]|nr:BamA/TamA family outer membrane protein [Planctomycetota bacterium]MBL7007633.1 BamA/TamA family outer membrane protein [Planctomycetota bacterium]
MLPRLTALLLALGAGAAPLAAAPQDEAPSASTSIIREIEILGAPGREAEILSAMRSKVGEPYSGASMNRDWEFLWNPMRIRLVEFQVYQLEDGVRLVLRVEEVPSLPRVVFEGNEEFEREDLLLAAGLTGAQSIDPARLPAIVGDLEAYYRREGYHFAQVRPRQVPERGEVRMQIQEGPLVRVGEVRFEGNQALPSSSFFGVGTNLSSAIEAGDGWFIFPGSKYAEGMVQRDVVSLEELYREYGYLDARVRLANEEFYRDDKRVILTFAVEEGPLYTVRSVRLEAEEGELSYPAEKLMAEIGLKPGQAYEKARVAADEAALRKFYGSRGHPASARGFGGSDGFFAFNAGNGGQPLLGVDTVAHRVDVVYRIQEGRQMHIRDVLILGNTQTQDRVIRREISLEPGDLADGDQAMRSWRRLMGKGWFQDPETRAPYVDWRFLETDDPDLADLQFEVAEGQTGRMLFGGGLNSSSGPFVSISLQKDNFDLFDTPSSLGEAWSEILDGRAFTGGGQMVRLFLAPGTQFSQYRLDFSEPDLFGDHIDRWPLNVGLFKSFYFLDTHDERRSGGSVSLGRNFGRFAYFWVSPSVQTVDVTDLSAGAPAMVRQIRGSNDYDAVTVGFSYNTVEDRFSPVDGGGFRVSYARAGGPFGGDWDFHTTDLSAEKFFPVWTDSLDRKSVLAVSGRVRHQRELGSLSVVPYSERIFLGGHSTLRGFDFRGVGPRRGLYPLGGEAAWNGSLELRFPLVSTRVRESVAEVEYVRGAFWLDAGAVGPHYTALGPPRVGAGFGIRIRIPFMPTMPLALDFGWPLQSERFDDERVFSFTFGNF